MHLCEFQLWDIGTFEKTTNLVNRACKRYAPHGSDDQGRNSILFVTWPTFRSAFHLSREKHKAKTKAPN